jgi:hypothetical protein
MLQLRKLYLQLPFVGTRTLSENIQDQTGTVQYPTFKLFFQVTLLGRRQGMIEKHNLGLMGLHGLANLFYLAGADKKPGVGLAAPGDQQIDRVCTGGCDELFKFLAILLL